MKPHWLLLSGALLLPATPIAALTPPERFFKQSPGTDYYLANYSEYEAYLKKLAEESDRIKLVDIGRTAEGRI
ncbi:hypothetical protein U5A82_02595 [Sphingobium sp. CR2-8]|uniref:hypothetical protein n=1 Tax=Sphingobium sp. CR2-8 TaxID=1306534 RepID=UPI002DB94510|nr:hypothetical protein [Sphingobium sp. CR2-8]MEC3909403.1 hypothetical protein [Sphingobium sp. CR2-8]